MTREVVTAILDELCIAVFDAHEAMERNDLRESIRLVSKVVDLTYVALDGLHSLPECENAIENLTPCLPVYKRALVAVTAGSCRLALQEAWAR